MTMFFRSPLGKASHCHHFGVLMVIEGACPSASSDSKKCTWITVTNELNGKKTLQRTPISTTPTIQSTSPPLPPPHFPPFASSQVCNIVGSPALLVVNLPSNSPDVFLFSPPFPWLPKTYLAVDHHARKEFQESSHGLFAAGTPQSSSACFGFSFHSASLDWRSFLGR